ncbi:MAG: lytic transglycosylase [Rheinheimera sp.]|uniref:lytic transglycosylase n=1 Tax=Arsukibacterium sp. UBA3155 TaxID=1946058 RepID=UPI000C96999E|nr:LysM peptidoglycan-binding domain-containing protein [Arsukibacterium sp. UBA3155]MAD77194.1 lytic transglycosylase [Rheinheimera sp.]|tara:strand:- start:31554 stop:33149 length:1596 start_codon:yes stop_codon:yes gene_type:complete
MHLKISAVMLVALLSGCVSTTETSAPASSKPKTNTPPLVQVKGASAELIASRLWNGAATPEQLIPLDATELEDLWQRIQLQLTFEVPQTRPIVEQRNFYSQHQSYLDRVANRAQPFLYYIVQELEKRNMPLELALLPIVESAFDPFAYSHARASGMWQFMPATGTRFGLKQNFWYDGRRDVIESTRAALDYLQYLYNTLEHDWLNAIAAYNAGEGRIGRAIRANQKRRLPTDFWSLDLPAETTVYVPKLLALVDILKRPDDFDIVWKFISNEPKIAVVATEGQIDLAIAAELAGLSVAELQALNPGFNQWATDPDGPHQLVLPIAKVDNFSRMLAETASEDRLQWQRYTVIGGDTLGKIARQHKTTVDAITRLNELTGNTIRIGQHLLIPMSAKAADSYELSQQNRIAKAQNRSSGDVKTEYIVQSGDTLWDISRAHKVTVAELAKWNGMVQRDPLKTGQKLVMWHDSTTNPVTAITRTVNYKVRKGDSLARIAQRFSVSVAEIIKWNNINTERYLQPGQQLKLIVDVTQV